MVLQVFVANGGPVVLQPLGSVASTDTLEILKDDLEICMNL